MGSSPFVLIGCRRFEDDQPITIDLGHLSKDRPITHHTSLMPGIHEVVVLWVVAAYNRIVTLQIFIQEEADDGPVAVNIGFNLVKSNLFHLDAELPKGISEIAFFAAILRIDAQKPI